MKREILFKGKTMRGKNAGEWVYGAYFCMHHNDDRDHIHHFIIPDETPIPKDKTIGDVQVEVYEKSIGMFTGLHDKNGKKIFEGDLVKAFVPEYMSKNGFFLESEPQWYVGVVEWNEHALRYELRFRMDGSGITGMEFGWGGQDFEVVGTEYDNPNMITRVRPKLF